MTSILTIIAADSLDDSLLVDLREILVAAGATTLAPDWLAPDRAADLAFSGISVEQARAIVQDRLAGRPIDHVVQPAAGRRKKLLIADMDSTIVVGETLDDLAEFAGLKDRIAAITMRSMRGEIDFKAALRERVGLLKGLSAAALEETERRITLMPGARTLVATMRNAGAFCVLVSGGFDHFTAAVRVRCGFQADRANRLEISNGALTGKVAEPILDRDSKLRYLQDFALQQGLALADTLAVGDGANDLAMIRAAGLGVAYQAKPIVAAEAQFRVDFNDLTALLFAQGYRQDAFSDAVKVESGDE